MKKYEKKALLKFFGIYFGSVFCMFALSGTLYYSQQKSLFLKNEILSMIEYSKVVKHSNDDVVREGFSYKLKDTLPKNEDPSYYWEDDTSFYKEFNQRRKAGGMVVIKSKASYESKLEALRQQVIFFLVVVIGVLAVVSWWLARLAIAPMQETIISMDEFIKDVIHDINTPISAIMMNLQLLRRDANEGQLQKIERIERSAGTIASLYENMSILLSEEKLTKSDVRLDEIARDRLEVVKSLYPALSFIYEGDSPILVQSHPKALERIIDNLLTNACKYNREAGSVMITCKERELQISDTGIGMQFPERIFERHYHENESGFGIGMHIVHRLCDRLNIQVAIHSVKGEGTIFSLHFS